MAINRTLSGTLLILSALVSSGCDDLNKIKLVDKLQIQQEEQRSKIEQLEKQQKENFEIIQKQQQALANSTGMLTTVVKELKRQQDTFTYTEFNPLKTKYFILNNGSVELIGKILSINAIDNGSAIQISLVNTLSTPVSNIGFHATWGGEKPTNEKALAQWQQLLFKTSMNSSLQLLPGQWQDITLSLRGISPNNLKYLKLSINMENLLFDNLQPVDNKPRKNKR